jgi:hypothetical protein
VTRSCLAHALGVLLCLLVGPLRAESAFTAQQRTTFVAQAEAQVRAAAKVDPEFWNWLDRCPAVKTGLLTVAQPVPAVFAENLDLMRRLVGPARAERYPHLLLAVALTTTPIGPTSASAPGQPPESVAALAGWMKANAVTFETAMADKLGVLAKAGLPATLAKDSGFFEQVAWASGTYPPRLSASIPDYVTWVIDHYEQKPPADARQAWPLFPLDKAPYPLLTWYQRTVPLRECDWMWERYWGRVAGQPAGLIGYGRYTWDYEKPAVKYKASVWHPSAVPRMWEDGGVCGRLSTMADCFRRSLALPAAGVGQPGHRAFIAYGYDAGSGRYGCGVGQSIAGIEATSGGTGLPAINSFLGGRAVHCFATVAAVNLGLERYQNSLIAAHLARAETTPARKQALYEAAVQLNPYHLGAWKELADLTGADPRAANALLAKLDSYLFSPDGALALTDPRLSPDTDFAKLPGAGEPPAVNKLANHGTDIARIVGDVVGAEMYQRVLKSGAEPVVARDLLRAELARRQAKRVPYGPALAVDLAMRFDLLADGVARSKTAAAEAVMAADKVQGKPRAGTVANAVTRVRLVAEAQPPRDAEAWLAGLMSALVAASPRIALADNGAATAEALYGELQKLRAASLGRLGKPGAREVKALNEAFGRQLQDYQTAATTAARARRETLAKDLAVADGLAGAARNKAMEKLLALARETSLALPTTEADAWLTPLMAEIRGRRPTFTMVKGKPVPEAVYGALRGMLVAALQRGGGPGKARLAEVEAAYQAELKAFAP